MTTQTIAIIGNGMATSKLLDELVASPKARERFEIHVFTEEPEGCYNRILLSRVLAGEPASSIELKSRAWYEQHGVQLHLARVAEVNVVERTLRTDRGEPGQLRYDRLVFATGSRPLFPEVPGTRDERGEPLDCVHLFRTVADVRRIRADLGSAKTAVVVGGGLLGLEAAKGLLDAGLKVSVLERAPGLLRRQLDETGSKLLGLQLAEMGLQIELATAIQEAHMTESPRSVTLEDGRSLPADLLVFSCGIVPRVELARKAELPVNRGIMVTPHLSVEGFDDVFAIGECAECLGEVPGLVAPTWQHARIAAKTLLGLEVAPYKIERTYTKLKVSGVSVASMGNVEYQDSRDEVVQVIESQKLRYRKLITREGRLVGAQFVGDVSAATRAISLLDSGAPVPDNPCDIFASDDLAAATTSQGDREVCNCERVTEGKIREAIAAGAKTVEAVSAATRACTGCGSCKGEVQRLVRKATQ